MQNDLSLRTEILRALEEEPQVEPAGIAVAVKDGVATIFGTVDSVPQRWAVEHTVLRVSGVRAVANELDVRLPREQELPDEELARNVIVALDAEEAVPDGHVRAVARHGKVILSGDVNWKFQRDAAVAAVRNLPGVKQVVNEIVLTPSEHPPDVKTSVEQALARSPHIDTSSILVELVAGKVFLRGAARTWAEREEAERLALQAPGVVAVENELVVRVPEVVRT
jgi:osmotically-inducible protein OsmY